MELSGHFWISGNLIEVSEGFSDAVIEQQKNESHERSLEQDAVQGSRIAKHIPQISDEDGGKLSRNPDVTLISGCFDHGWDALKLFDTQRNLSIDFAAEQLIVLLLKYIIMHLYVAQLRNLRKFDHIVCRILEFSHLAIDASEVISQLIDRTLINLATVLQHKKSIEQLEHLSARLMDRGNDCPTIGSFFFEHFDDAVGGGGIHS